MRPDAETPEPHSTVQRTAPATFATRATSALTDTDEIVDEVLDDDDDRPTVEHQAWIKQDDYWQRTTYIAITGRQTASAPHTRPLPRPRRFRRPAPLRSAMILLLTLALIVLIPIGVVLAKQEAESHIKLPTSIPGLTQPTPTHIPVATSTTVKPTATPKKKK